MGRSRGPKKFSFPLPRRSRSKVGDDEAHSTPSIPSAAEWPPSHREEPTSKAHRVLGTSEALYRSTSGQTSRSSIPPSPGFMSVTVSEATRGSQIDERTCTVAADNGYPIRPGISKRPSSNILGRTYTTDGGRSDNSSVSHRLHQQTSSSTMRSHYDAKNSPLSISQQTSNSAVRDRALRRGKPPVVTTDYDDEEDHAIGPASPHALRAPKKESRKSKPAKLDLSKLFPKPKTGGDGREYGPALFSPTKMVNSPAAMSMVSDYFPRPMTREPTPQIGEQAKLKTTSRHQNPIMHSDRTPSSPVRKFKRDEYDNAKVHVRRPPKGVQHWFDALDEDSDETSDDTKVPLYAPKAVRANVMPQIPVRKASLDRLSTNGVPSRRDKHPSRFAPGARHDTFSHEDLVDVSRLTSPSEYSLNTQNSMKSTKTKESAISKTNLQDSSVLSISSSEDEFDHGSSKARKFAVRKSLDMSADADDVVIGQAQAFELRQHRRPSIGMMSTRTSSTSAATIEVMYTPEPPFPAYNFPRRSDYSGYRLSGHIRQPSVIHEDEDFRPQTALNAPLSPDTRSIVSARTSASEPHFRANGSRKMMAVTAEEEALLELMRKKRAAMSKAGTRQSEYMAFDTENREQPPRTSAFLSMDASPKPTADIKNNRQPSPLLLPPRGRALKSVHESDVTTSQLRDSSASASDWSDRHNSPVSQRRLPHYLPTPAEFSPLEPFPPSPPTRTTSVVSPTTTEHASPLPSPRTPKLRYGERDIDVKVASSDTSNELEEVTVLENGILGTKSDSVKSDASFDSSSRHQRRRTASSGTDVSFPIPPKSRDLPPVSEMSSRPSSIIEPTLPKLPKHSSKRISGLALSAMTSSISRTSSVHSNSSRTSSYSQSSSINSGFEKRKSKRPSRRSVTSHPRDDRNSVSDDVLAAWNSLGGTY